ncbi:hypothetical protein EE612_041009, partial [Oryza sativa]
DYGTNQAYVFYGHSRDFQYVGVEDLPKCAHVIAELPPQSQSMSLMDVQIWIIKLFRLHPETQDLSIKGFYSDYCPSVLIPEWYFGYWITYDCLRDESWASFAKKVRGRRNGMEMFVLYVDSSEIKHSSSLIKAIPDDYSQLETAVLPDGKSLSSFFPLNCTSKRLTEDLTMTTTEIAAYLAQYYGDQYSRAGAWRAKMKALELRYGTFYDSHNYAPRLLKDIKHKHPYSFVDIKDTEVADCKDFRVLHRIFWAFDQCRRSFMHCRPVICIKGTPLCGKYQGVLMTALAFDANDYCIPVAFAVVEGESKESWLWFLRNVNHSVVNGRSNVCLIHDYKRELLDAVEDLQDSPEEAYPWRGIQSRWCVEHLAESFFAHFGDRKLVMLFKKLCQQSRPCKFGKIWKELDELTLKYTQEKESGASGEIQQESVEHGETEFVAQSPHIHLDSVGEEVERNCAGGTESKITRFSEWIGPKPMEKWSLLYDKNDARYGIMGTSIADLYKDNHVMKGIRCLPLSGLLDLTYRRMAECYDTRSAAAKKSTGNPLINFPECIQDEMKAKLQKAETHHVTCINSGNKNAFFEEGHGIFKVQSKNKYVIVELTQRETQTHKHPKVRTVISGNTIHNTLVREPVIRKAHCSCNKLKLLRKPCSHVIAVCCQVGVSPDTYMSPYYTLAYLADTWRGKFDASEALGEHYTLGDFCRDPCYSTLMLGNPPTWIPDKRMECGLPAFLTSDGTQNGVDEEEQQCSIESVSSAADNQGTENRSSRETDQV